MKERMYLWEIAAACTMHIAHNADTALYICLLDYIACAGTQSVSNHIPHIYHNIFGSHFRTWFIFGLKPSALTLKSQKSHQKIVGISWISH